MEKSMPKFSINLGLLSFLILDETHNGGLDRVGMMPAIQKRRVLIE